MSLQAEMQALKKVHEEGAKSNETQNKEISDALSKKEEQVLKLKAEVESLIKVHEEEAKTNESKIKEVQDDLRAKDE